MVSVAMVILMTRFEERAGTPSARLRGRGGSVSVAAAGERTVLCPRFEWPPESRLRHRRFHTTATCSPC